MMIFKALQKLAPSLPEGATLRHLIHTDRQRSKAAFLKRLDQMFDMLFTSIIFICPFLYAVMVWSLDGGMTLSVTVLGLLIAGRVGVLALPMSLLQTLPVRSGDIARSHLRVGLEVTTFAAGPLSALLVLRFLIWSPSVEPAGWFAVEAVGDLVILICVVMLALAFRFPGSERHGALPTHRRVYAVGQFLAVLAFREMVASTAESRSLGALAIGTLALFFLVLLAATTLRTQLKAADHTPLPLTRRSHWPLTRRSHWLEMLLLLVMLWLWKEDPLAGSSTLRGAWWVGLAGLLLWQPLRIREAVSHPRLLAFRCLDAIFVLVLVAAELGLYFELSSQAHYLGVEFVAVFAWFAFQTLIESPRLASLSLPPRKQRSPHATRKLKPKVLNQPAGEMHLPPRTMDRKERLRHLLRVCHQRWWAKGDGARWIGIAAVLAVGWFIIPDLTSAGLDAAMLMIGVIVALSALALPPPMDLLETLPIRPGEIARIRLRWSVKMTAVIGLLLFAQEAIRQTGGESFTLESVPHLALQAVGNLTLVGFSLIFSLAIGLPTVAGCGALSARRMTYTAFQGWVVLHCRLVAGSASSTGASWALALETLPLVLLVALAVGTFQTQLQATDRMPMLRKAPDHLAPVSEDEIFPVALVIIFLLVVLSPAIVPWVIMTTMVLWQPILFARAWERREPWKSMVIDAAFVFVLAGVEVSRAFGSIETPPALLVQLLTVGVWFTFRRLGSARHDSFLLLEK